MAVIIPMKSKKTLILGASPNPARYANMAARRLVQAGHEIINVGIRKGEVAGAPIQSAERIHEEVNTITLYIGPHLQPQYYDYILHTGPKRIIFNPGTENPVLTDIARKNGIEAIQACTLVLLNTNQY